MQRSKAEVIRLERLRKKEYLKEYYNRFKTQRLEYFREYNIVRAYRVCCLNCERIILYDGMKRHLMTKVCNQHLSTRI